MKREHIDMRVLPIEHIAVGKLPAGNDGRKWRDL